MSLYFLLRRCRSERLKMKLRPLPCDFCAKFQSTAVGVPR